ncbi:MAG: hypothetical protein AAF289_01180 [Cyanobacteria bacterium P01_A01_bin.135]
MDSPQVFSSGTLTRTTPLHPSGRQSTLLKTMALLPASDQSGDERYLNELKSSDEDVESLLSAGADIDQLIAAGILNGEENWGWQDVEDVPDLDEAEAAALIGCLAQRWGLDLEAYHDAPNQPH